MITLFNMNSNLYDYTENIKRNIDERIKSMDDIEILSNNENDCIQYLIKLFKVDFIELYPDEISYAKKSKKIYKKDLPRKISFNPYEKVEVPSIVLSVPFKGDMDLLIYRPSRFQLPPNNFYIENGSICFDLLKLNNDSEGFKREVNKSKDYLTIMFENMNNDIVKINQDLEIYIKNAFKNKKENLIKENDFFVSLDIPESNSGKINKKTYSIPINYQNKISINFEKLSKLNPTLDYNTYKEILTSIYKYCSSFEQHPETCKHHDEEGIRDLVLAHLSSIIDESVTAESINKSGKTDILIKHGISNIFVSECKIWYGKKVILKQLTNY